MKNKIKLPGLEKIPLVFDEVQKGLEELAGLSQTRQKWVAAELDRRYLECNSRGHKQPEENVCRYCYRTTQTRENIEPKEEELILQSKDNPPQKIVFPCSIEYDLYMLTKVTDLVSERVLGKLEIAREFGYIK